MNERLSQDGEENENFVAPDNSGTEQAESTEDIDVLERKASALYTAVNALENRSKENSRLGAKNDDEFENLRNELKERYDKIQNDLKNNPDYQEKMNKRMARLKNEKLVQPWQLTEGEKGLAQKRARIWSEYQNASIGSDKAETDRLRQELDKIDDQLGPKKREQKEHESEFNEQMSGR